MVKHIGAGRIDASQQSC